MMFIFVFLVLILNSSTYFAFTIRNKELKCVYVGGNDSTLFVLSNTKNGTFIECQEVNIPLPATLRNYICESTYEFLFEMILNKCRELHSNKRDSIESKFGNFKKFIGTNWCRAGTISNDTKLGFFSKSDECCRQRYFCQLGSDADQTEFDNSNSTMLGRKSCKCDEQFCSCLTKSNCKSAFVLGYLYFHFKETKSCYLSEYRTEENGCHFETPVSDWSFAKVISEIFSTDKC